ncbi:MAG: thiamine-phosphate kinase [Nitrospirales bacterium]
MTRASSRRTVAALGEFELIKLIQSSIATSNLPSPYGIGDDAAILRPSPGYEWLTSKDLLIEGIHFDPSLSSYQDIGYKAAAVNVSDIAAMGGIPLYLLLGLAIPPSTPVLNIQNLYRGLNKLCKEYEIKLIGGDTTASRSDICLSLTIIGKIRSKQALCRGGAKVGDLIYVTGTLGDSGAGLRLLRQTAHSTTKQLPKSVIRFLIKRHLHPTPPVQFSHLLAMRQLATSAIDISDGLSGDIRHICQASHVGALIQGPQIPRSTQCVQYLNHDDHSFIDLALHSGEDYELLFTVSPNKQEPLRRIATRLGQHISQIGTIQPYTKKIYLQQIDGSRIRMIKQSYDHFYE